MLLMHAAIIKNGQSRHVWTPRGYDVLQITLRFRTRALMIIIYMRLISCPIKIMIHCGRIEVADGCRRSIQCSQEIAANVVYFGCCLS